MLLGACRGRISPSVPGGSLRGRSSTLLGDVARPQRVLAVSDTLEELVYTALTRTPECSAKLVIHDTTGRQGVAIMTETKKIKHLELIQGVITRLSEHSFRLKTFGLIQVLGAMVHLCLGRAVPIVASLVIWWLDALFLRNERTGACTMAFASSRTSTSTFLWTWRA